MKKLIVLLFLVGACFAQETKIELVTKAEIKEMLESMREPESIRGISDRIIGISKDTTIDTVDRWVQVPQPGYRLLYVEKWVGIDTVINYHLDCIVNGEKKKFRLEEVK